MQTVPIKVSSSLQRIHHQINNQLIFLNFEAVHGKFSLLCKNNIDETRTLVVSANQELYRLATVIQER